MFGEVWGRFGEVWGGFGEVWGGFGEGLGRVWGGFGEGLGRVWEGFGDEILKPLAKRGTAGGSRSALRRPTGDERAGFHRARAFFYRCI